MFGGVVHSTAGEKKTRCNIGNPGFCARVLYLKSIYSSEQGLLCFWLTLRIISHKSLSLQPEVLFLLDA